MALPVQVFLIVHIGHVQLLYMSEAAQAFQIGLQTSGRAFQHRRQPGIVLQTLNVHNARKASRVSGRRPSVTLSTIPAIAIKYLLEQINFEILQISKSAFR